MDVDKIQSRRGAPMSEQPRLYMLESQRFAQQRIRIQIDLSNRKIIRSAPVSVSFAQLFGR